jgi:hypothetical protein
MNVLAPVSRNGRLQISMAGNAGGVQGFQAGEFRVFDPETRRRAMHDRAGGAACPWLTLDEVVSRDVASLKRSVSQARLVVVHSREIDEAGEKGIGPAVFDLALQKLRAAWRVLREAGVRRFVFTADHGFLVLDDDAAAVQAYGRRVDPQRRYVFSPAAADRGGRSGPILPRCCQPSQTTSRPCPTPRTPCTRRCERSSKPDSTSSFGMPLTSSRPSTA